MNATAAKESMTSLSAFPVKCIVKFRHKQSIRPLYRFAAKLLDPLGIVAPIRKLGIPNSGTFL